MDMGVGCGVGFLGKKIEVDQDKEDKNSHCTCKGLIFVTVFVVLQFRIVIDFPIKFYVRYFMPIIVLWKRSRRPSTRTIIH